MKLKIQKALNKLDKHANDNISLSLVQGQEALIYLSAKEEQKLNDIFYFFRVENLVYIEVVESDTPTNSQGYHLMRAIPLPNLVQILNETEAK